MNNLEKHILHIVKRNRNKGVIASLIALDKVSNEFIGIDTPEIIAHRIAVQGPQAHIENSPELYGMSIRQTRQKYFGDVHACHAGKNDCDAEMSETDKAIVGATLHLGDVEKPV